MLAKIFSHLPLRELSYLSTVSTQWRSISRNVIAHRHSLCHIFQLFRINSAKGHHNSKRKSKEDHLKSNDLHFIANDFDEMEDKICRELKESEFAFCISHFYFILIFGSFFILLLLFFFHQECFLILSLLSFFMALSAHTVVVQTNYSSLIHHASSFLLHVKFLTFALPLD